MKRVLFCVLISFSFYSPVKNDQTRCPIPPSDFEEVLKNHLEKNQLVHLFVDKTLFINAYLHAGKKIIITKPPKWSKSLNLNMLYRFLNIETDKQGNKVPDESRTNNLIFTQSIYQTVTGRDRKFPKLKISDHPEAMTHQGKYPVLFVDFSQVLLEEGTTLEHVRYDLSKYFGELLNTQYPYLEEYIKGDSITKVEKERLIRAYNGTQRLDDLPQCIHFITKLLYWHFNNTPVHVLVDDYDRVVNKVFLRYGPRSSAFQEVVAVITNMYHMAFKSKDPYVGQVLLTGMLPYLRVEAQLEDFDLYSITEDTKFTEYYGFTDAEVKHLIKASPFISEQKAKQIMHYYSGYSSDGKTNLHNPFSILRCVGNKGALEEFWRFRGMSSDSYSRKAMISPKITKNFQLITSMKEIEGDEPPKNLTYVDLTKDIATFSLLAHHGCLAISGKKGNRVLYKVPNDEAKSIFLDGMRG